MFVQFVFLIFKLYKMVPRHIQKEVLQLAKEFPVVALLGPRQSGKTTLSKMLFPDYVYVSLEDPDNRDRAKTDPRGFFNTYNQHVIIDEIQYVPELFSYIQGLADEAFIPARFIITGSQNYLMSEKISQSLAGRVGIATILPFSLRELSAFFSNEKPSTDQIMFNGSYPSVFDRNIRPDSFYATYVSTYLERDVRMLSNISDFGRFNTFIRLLAGRTGQLLNKNELSVEAGISHNTVENWISVLEAAYVVFRLKPWFKNFNKRLVKQPKLYFYDTGLVCYLLGLRDAMSVSSHYYRGHLFENLIISDIVKENQNSGNRYGVWFWRDNHKKEIDLIIDRGQQAQAIEIKSGDTFRAEFLDALLYWRALTGVPKKDLYLVYSGEKTMEYMGVRVLNHHQLALLFVPSP